MRDIVETIQAEQDHIIRSGLDGVLVVQGGPGTGKTAVALHRAAYLLYTYRRQLEKRGVLVVGPNADLPALHRPGPAVAGRDRRAAVHRRRPVPRRQRRPAPSRRRPPRSRAGRRMAEVLAAAVRDRQQVPREPVEIIARPRDAHAGPPGRQPGPASGPAGPGGRTTWPGPCSPARSSRSADRSQAAGPARRATCSAAPQPARRGRRSTTCAPSCAPIPEVQAAIERLWPVLTPQQLLADLFASKRRLATAAPGLSQAERDALLRARRRRRAGPRPTCRCWTRPPSCSARTTGPSGPSGPPPAAAARPTPRACWTSSARDRRRRPRGADGRRPHRRRVPGRPARGRGATSPRPSGPPADRTWAFGHVIVDEAQELSPMAWRMLMRRMPEPVDDHRRRRGPDRRPGRPAVLGRRARAVRGGPVAAGRADRQLPHARRDHGRSPPTCWPRIDPALDAPALGARDRGAPRGAGRPRRGGLADGRGRGRRDAGRPDRRRQARP